jgi:transcriptional regulator with XRE-family HTH domain
VFFTSWVTLRHNHSELDPARLRGIFGRNLRLLSAPYASVAALCRELGINRTQFNRYLSGESFPRPDVLHRICLFFGVDARVLLEPVESVNRRDTGLLDHPMVQEFFGRAPTDVPQSVFPSGFFRFIRRSFMNQDLFAVGLVHVSRQAGYTFLRGYEPRSALRHQGISMGPSEREFRGVVMRQQDGVMAIVAHRGSHSSSFNFLTPERTFQHGLWEGYATRTVPERMTGRRATRMIYEHLGSNRALILETARQAGLAKASELPAYHINLLRLDEEFR